MYRDHEKKRDAEFNRRYVNAIKAIIGRITGEPAFLIDWRVRFTYKIDRGEVIVHIRRNAAKEHRDFTVRSVYPRSKTDFDYFAAGRYRYSLYVWTNADGTIDRYVLVDLDRMRKANLFNDHIRAARRKMNRDGVTGFVAYDLGELRGVGAIAHDSNPEPEGGKGPKQDGLGRFL